VAEVRLRIAFFWGDGSWSEALFLQPLHVHFHHRIFK
jgi:hypothetical protein